MSYIDPRYGNSPYVQEWSLNVQRELFKKTFIDVGYVATKATGLYGGLTRLNQIPWSAVQQYGTNLTATIKSPADAAKYGIPYPYAGFNNTLAAAIRQFPQLYGAGSFTTINGTDGFSTFNSLQVTVNRQIGHGLQVYSNYVWSKDMSNLNGPLDVNNRKNEKAIESFDIPQMLKAYVTYELPVGKGHALLGNAAPRRQHPGEGVVVRHHRQLLQRHAAGLQRHQPHARLERRQQPRQRGRGAHHAGHV